MKILGLYYKYNKRHPLQIFITTMDGHDDFERIALFLEQECGVTRIERFVGLDDEAWDFKKGELKFRLYYDELYGIYLIALKDESVEVVEEVARSLEKRFKD